MEKMTMGMFIAALRKEKGMTQQQVADRLGVSNKAVSRWERDENAPDIILLPALAELFSVTCDELLRGERSAKTAVCSEKEPFAAQQINRLARRTLSDFKTMTYISLALSAVGLVCMFGISYGFYRPVIGFAVLLLFVLAAVLLEVIAVTRLRDRKMNSELLTCAAPPVLQALDTALGVVVCGVFRLLGGDTAVTAACTVHLLLCQQCAVDRHVFCGIFRRRCIAVDSAVAAASRAVCRVDHGTAVCAASHRSVASPYGRMAAWRGGIGGTLFIVAPWFDREPYGTSIMLMLNYTGLVLLAADIVVFIVVMCHAGDKRQRLLLPGVRNMLMIPSGFLMSMVHMVGYVNYEEEGSMSGWERYDIWSPEYAVSAVAAAVVVYGVFVLIEYVLSRKPHK